MLGRSLFDFIDEAERAEADEDRRARSECEGDDGRDEHDLRLATVDGRLVWARVRSSAVRQPRRHVPRRDRVRDRRHRTPRARATPRGGGSPRLRSPAWPTAPSSSRCSTPILEQGALTAALYVDLDGFKEVNDQFGHTLGDELLRSVAARMPARSASIDTLARVGGDEFVVICRELESTEEAVTIGRRIREVLGQPFRLAVGSVRIDSSIGIAFGRTTDADGLFARADQALYRAKRKGRGRIEIALDEAAA